MVVYNTGYLKKADVIALAEKGVKFGIYQTYKNTNVLVKIRFYLPRRIELYQPQSNRLPYKLVDGKKITYGDLIFDSMMDNIELLDTTNWNNGNQIISYEDYFFEEGLK